MPARLFYTPPLILCCAFAAFGGPAIKAAFAADTPPARYSSAQNPFEKFTPRPSRTARLDHSLWDTVLSKTVLYTGPATRKRANRPQPIAGSHFIVGHSSPYRMEGNKVSFAALDAGHLDALADIRGALETIAARHDIAAFSRNEQLAFWINLHNAALTEQIALAYPEKTPSKIYVRTKDGDKARLHEAKILNIGGAALSLRDIREKIVYPNWDDPVVAYGFFLGDIGSPSLMPGAYTGDNVQDLLAENAREFTNALRGFHTYRGKGMVSRLYQDIAPFYFPDFPQGLRAHLTRFTDEDVAAELAGVRDFKIAAYEDDIADLSGGTRMPASIAGTLVNGQRLGGTGAAVYVSELAEKRKLLIKQGKITPGRGRVTIEDKPEN